MAWNGFLKIFKQSPVSDNVGKLRERKKIRKSRGSGTEKEEVGRGCDFVE